MPGGAGREGGERIGSHGNVVSRRGTENGSGQRRELRASASPRGRVDSTERERVAEIQRARMLGAMVDLTRERGAERVTVAHVVGRAGVSRRTFYELFEDREACLLEALDEALRRIEEAVLPAYRRERGWSARIGAALTAMLECFDADPATAALCVVDSLAAGPEALERRAHVVDALVGAVDRGRREAGAPAGLNRVTAEGVVGAVLGVLYTRLRETAPKPLLPLRGQLMSMIVLPYLGPEAAAAELARRIPRARRPGAQPGGPAEAAGHAPHLPHDARTGGGGGAAGAQQPPDRARRGRCRPGPDVEAADAPGGPRVDRQRRREPGARRAEHVAADPARRGARAGDPRPRGALRLRPQPDATLEHSLTRESGTLDSGLR